MSDDEMSDTDQPPALEDADIDDVSSGASVVTESSASVSIDTDHEAGPSARRSVLNNVEALLMEEDDESDESSIDSDDSYSGHDEDDGALGPAFIVPLKTGSDDEDEDDDEDDLPCQATTTGRVRRRRSTEERNEALERNSLRRQASNEMLAAMRAAAMSAASEQEEARNHVPRRVPPARTKSGDLVNGGKNTSEDDDGPRRRPPPRTKSGDGMGGSTAPPRRRPPPRTKSGDGMVPIEPHPARCEPSGPGNLGEASECGDFVVPLRCETEDDDNFLMSPSGRRRRTVQEREQALSRNAVRRQASSDMLRAMRDATMTRAPPERAKSSAATLQRRPPPRTKSGDGLEGTEAPQRPEPRRRPPARTKSGDGIVAEEKSSAPPRRRPPARTFSAGVYSPPTAIIEE